MILVAIGANLASERFGSPLAACRAALSALNEAGVRVVRCSRWYRSAPVPPSESPWFVNGVALVETDLAAPELLARLHRIEDEFGRRRGVRNAPRTLDLDLLAHGDIVTAAEERLSLPHPRLHERAFVLLPLAEVAPDWRHPASGASVEALIQALPPGQVLEPLEDSGG